jgi:hypothetical protein
MAALGVPGMGIGRLGAPDVILTRKFRFEMAVLTPGGGVVPPSFVRMSGLPSISMDVLELNFLNDKTFTSGKITWEPITVTYLNSATVDVFPLYNWLASVYNFTNTSRTMGTNNASFMGSAIINLYDGCGTILSQWTLGNCFPEAINFGALDYSDTGPVEIELTMRYSNVTYQSFCPAFVPTATCKPCGTL